MGGLPFPVSVRFAIERRVDARSVVDIYIPFESAQHAFATVHCLAESIE
jgi:hypothetical protein